MAEKTGKYSYSTVLPNVEINLYSNIIFTNIIFSSTLFKKLFYGNFEEKNLLNLQKIGFQGVKCMEIFAFFQLFFPRFD